jgi:hypothetical protein
MTDDMKYKSKAIPSRLCTDPKFKYFNSSQTDVRRTWRKARLLILLSNGAAYESRP